MSAIKKFCTSFVGCKIIMALSGIGLVGFLLAHLAGNLLVFVGPKALNFYAESLRQYPVVLWALRIGLICMFVAHILSGLYLWKLNRSARKVPYQRRSYQETSFAARSMMLSGLIVISFVIYHLAHLTFRATDLDLEVLGDYDVYSMLVISFNSAFVSSFYIISIVLMMIHLSHGISSLLQTLSITNKDSIVSRYLGPLVASSLAVGFVSIPVSIYFGFIY